MNWLLFAFTGPVLWALSTHIDKYLVERYFKHSNVAVLLIFTSLISIVMLPFIAWFQSGISALPAGNILLITLSGLLYMGALHFYLAALKNEEASVVGAYFQITPLFGAALAYIFMDEVLSYPQLTGIALVIVGAVILSLRVDGGPHRFKLRLLLLMMACTFTIAVSTVIFNVFALRIDFWVTTFWTYTGEALYGIALLGNRKIRQEFSGLLRTNTVAILSVNATNELINLGGGLGARYALLLAPLGLVQAIGSTTPLFVFIFGVLISLLAPGFGRENLSVRSLLQKAGSALLIVSGVILVSA